MQPIAIVKSDQESTRGCVRLRRQRKWDGKWRVVFTEESALRKSFAVAPLATKGAFYEMLIATDGQLPATDLCSNGAVIGAVAVSWEAPSSLGAHRACADEDRCRHGGLPSARAPAQFPLRPAAYAHALLLSTALAAEAAPQRCCEVLRPLATTRSLYQRPRSGGGGALQRCSTNPVVREFHVSSWVSRKHPYKPILHAAFLLILGFCTAHLLYNPPIIREILSTPRARGPKLSFGITRTVCVCVCVCMCVCVCAAVCV